MQKLIVKMIYSLNIILTINKIKESWIENEDFDGVSFHDKITYIHDSISGNIWNSIIKNQLSIELQSDEANIINLSYTSIDEQYAKQFVEILIEEMSKMYTFSSNSTGLIIL